MLTTAPATPVSSSWALPPPSQSRSQSPSPLPTGSSSQQTPEVPQNIAADIAPDVRARLQASFRHDMQMLKSLFANRRKAIVDWCVDKVTDWIVVEGLIEKTTFCVRAAGSEWQIFEGIESARPLEQYAQKKDAIQEAKRLAQAHRAHLAIFNREGVLQSQHSFWPKPNSAH